MATNDRNKGLAISSVMNNPDLKDILYSGISAPLGSSKRDKAKSILFNTGRVSGVIPDNFLAQTAGMTMDPNTGEMVPMQGQPDTKQPQPQGFIGPGGQTLTPDPSLQQDSSGVSVQGQPFAPSGVPQQDLSKLTVQESLGPTSKILFIPEAPPQKTNTIVDETFNKLALTDNLDAPWMPAHYKAIIESYKGREQDMPSFIVDDIYKLKNNWETAKDLSADKNFQDYWNNLPNTQNLTARDKQDFYLSWLDMGSPKVSKISSEYPADFKYPEDFAKYWKNQGLAEKDKGLYYQQWQEMGPAKVKKEGITLPLTPEAPPDVTSEEKSEFIENYADNPSAAYIQAAAGSASMTAFAHQFATDQQKLQNMNPGMPKEAVDNISGASLTNQVDSLGERKEEENALDKQIDYLLDVGKQIELQTDKDGYVSSVSEANIKAGTQDTLDAYIRGRDEYLNKIDGMIETTKDQMLEMDMANPMTNKMMTSYLNYLTVLKGRQNQRYINYVDSAIAQHQNSINAGIARYNILRQQYLEDKAMTQAQYEIDLKIGEEIWTTVHNMEKDGYDMSILQSKAQKAAADSLMSVLKVQDYNKTSGIYLGKNQGYYDNIMEASLEKNKFGKEKKTEIEMFNANLDGVFTKMQNEGKDPKGILMPLNALIKDNAYTAINQSENAGLDRYFNNYKDVISEFYNTYKYAEVGEDLTQEQKDEILKVTGPIAKDLKQTLFNNTKNELIKYATEKYEGGFVPSFGNDVRAAITDLLGSEGWIRKKPKSVEDIKDEASTEEWRGRHTSVPKTILDGIYDTVTIATVPEDFADPMEIFTEGYSSIEEVPIEVIIDIIVDEGMESGFNIF